MKKLPKEEDLLTQEEVAVMLGVSSRLLQKWRVSKDKKGPPFLRLGYRMVRYRIRDIEQWRRELKAA